MASAGVSWWRRSRAAPNGRSSPSPTKPARWSKLSAAPTSPGWPDGSPPPSSTCSWSPDRQQPPPRPAHRHDRPIAGQHRQDQHAQARLAAPRLPASSVVAQSATGDHRRRASGRCSGFALGLLAIRPSRPAVSPPRGPTTVNAGSHCRNGLPADKAAMMPRSPRWPQPRARQPDTGTPTQSRTATNEDTHDAQDAAQARSRSARAQFEDLASRVARRTRRPGTADRRSRQN